MVQYSIHPFVKMWFRLLVDFPDRHSLTAHGCRYGPKVRNNLKLLSLTARRGSPLGDIQVKVIDGATAALFSRR
ncbi:hypothetical protein DPMN_005445 [Dreissena polymorpha]|uniref:Uncharacterized protein n=1 Tax=Dreissena polymorpha TaxID=45954 RepID=A0A9D4RUI4_DREPO|nr:hypothetical protein DPMN_005445 [Dreissena polymorpha]